MQISRTDLYIAKLEKENEELKKSNTRLIEVVAQHVIAIRVAHKFGTISHFALFLDYMKL